MGFINHSTGQANGMKSLYKLSASCGTCLESHTCEAEAGAEFQASLGYLLRHWGEGVQRGEEISQPRNEKGVIESERCGITTIINYQT